MLLSYHYQQAFFLKNAIIFYENRNRSKIEIDY